MRFGVYVGPFYPGEWDGIRAFGFAQAMARTAHESGFDGIFAAHHYLLGPSHMSFHPFLMLARMAAECPGGYLGTAAFVLPLTHPVEVAEATSLLDVMCGGRFLFGVGKGYREVEFRSFGVPRAERDARLAEAVQADEHSGRRNLRRSRAASTSSPTSPSARSRSNDPAPRYGSGPTR